MLPVKMFPSWKRHQRCSWLVCTMGDKKLCRVRGQLLEGFPDTQKHPRSVSVPQPTFLSGHEEILNKGGERKGKTRINVLLYSFLCGGEDDKTLFCSISVLFHPEMEQRDHVLFSHKKAAAPCFFQWQIKRQVDLAINKIDFNFNPMKYNLIQ